MRLKGKIVALGDIIGQPGSLKQNVVMECDALRNNMATLEVWGDEKVAKLQDIKVGDEVAVEFRRQWHLITKKYSVIVVDNVRW